MVRVSIVIVYGLAKAGRIGLYSSRYRPRTNQAEQTWLIESAQASRPAISWSGFGLLRS